jgi:hypothetical protein
MESGNDRVGPEELGRKFFEAFAAEADSSDKHFEAMPGRPNPDTAVRSINLALLSLHADSNAGMAVFSLLPPAVGY